MNKPTLQIGDHYTLQGRSMTVTRRRLGIVLAENAWTVEVFCTHDVDSRESWPRANYLRALERFDEMVRKTSGP